MRYFHAFLNVFKICTGFPAAKELGGMEQATTDPAPIVAPDPIVVPFNRVTFAPMNTLSPIIRSAL